MHPTLAHYLVVAAALLGLGLYTVATRRHVVGMLLGVELILNAAVLNFLAFDHFLSESNGAGQVFALVVVAFAAAQAAIALAVVLQVYRTHRSASADGLTELRN